VSRIPPPASIEVWIDAPYGGVPDIGWKCLVCDAEQGGYESAAEAEEAANEHAADGPS
jgi:hypothetical protein